MIRRGIEIISPKIVPIIETIKDPRKKTNPNTNKIITVNNATKKDTNSINILSITLLIVV